MWWRGGEQRQDERRAHQRMDAAPSLLCSLGQIIDISRSGLAVVCRGKPPDRPGKLLEFTLRDAVHTLALSGHIVRLQITGYRRFEMGLSFVGLTAAKVQLLATIARLSAPEGPAPAARLRTGPTDYYVILGLPPDASPSAIRQAFHELARKYHPDASRTGDTARQFQLVHEAYSVLRDAGQRRAYDDATRLVQQAT